MMLIPEDLANTVLNYLASKPFIEVYKLIEALQQLKTVPDEETAE